MQSKIFGWLSCHSSSSGMDENKSTTIKGAAQEGCIFCPPNLTPDSPKFRVVHTSDQFIAFHDRSPAAAIHLLAVPRQHIDDVTVLMGEEGAKLILDLQVFGNEAIDLVESERTPSRDKLTTTTTTTTTTTSSSSRSTPRPSSDAERRFGFHIPPFRSVSHLHLHCQVLPYNSPMLALKYRISGDANAARKGWGWFVTAAQAAGIIQAGHKVTVRPCGDSQKASHTYSSLA
ncbi:Protein kinase C inhibitor-like protein [Ceraceosorus bombacis]|uniref:Protein kinase C inhibitor-like protein n=1 Tax=Ceraceosorus bombacis TaxID=401625 RepID=A0A0P1BKT8_9BASI|nr:Protein kinase C inhibitor-like protein [Ceraceosorus bombacis]